MILDRVDNFISEGQLWQANHELSSVPRWIYRNTYPNNFWRYYLLDDLAGYDERDAGTWYGNQTPTLISRLAGVWRELFQQVLEFAGSNFVLMRYTINGQTIGQDGVLHTDVDPNLDGDYRSYLCYLNTQWESAWAGATEILGPVGATQHEMPVPGKLIVFDSQALHRGLAPSEHGLLRLTMLWHGKHM